MIEYPSPLDLAYNADKPKRKYSAREYPVSNFSGGYDSSSAPAISDFL